MASNKRVALVHDYWVNMRGGERIFLALKGMFPEADDYVLIRRRDAMPQVSVSLQLRASPLQWIPYCASHYRALLPLYPLAARCLDLTGYDLVISSSSGFCHSVRTSGVHVCYCHAPMRYAWNEYQATISSQRFPLTRAMLAGTLSYIRRMDYAAAQRVTQYVANSTAVQARIAAYYGRSSLVVHPFVDTLRFQPAQPAGAARDYFLVVSQLLPYKRVDLAVEACTRLGRPLFVVGDGPERSRLERMAGASVKFLGRAPDEQLPDLYANCAALLQCGEEDFGIAALEAQACGRPVIAYGAGGACETVIAGQTGILFPAQSTDVVVDALRDFRAAEFDPQVIRQHAERFDVTNFSANMLRAIENATGASIADIAPTTRPVMKHTIANAANAKDGANTLPRAGTPATDPATTNESRTTVSGSRSPDDAAPRMARPVAATLAALPAQTATHTTQAATQLKALGRRMAASLRLDLPLIVEWFFLLITAILPLDIYLTLPAQESGVFSSQVLTLEAVVMLAAAFVYTRARKRPIKLGLTRSDLIPLGLVVLASLASITGAYSHALAFKESLKVAVYLGIYALARACHTRPGIRKRAFIALLMGYVAVIVVGVAESLSRVRDVVIVALNIHVERAAIPVSNVTRQSATFRYPNELAAYLLLLLPLLGACMVKAPRWWQRIACGALTLLGGYALMLSYTRGATVALLVAIPVLLALLVRNKWVVVIGLVGALALGVGLALAPSPIGGRVSTLLSLSDQGYIERWAAWRWAVTAFAHRPIFGVGAGNLQVLPGGPSTHTLLGGRETDAENLLLNVLAELGIVGLAAVMYCLAGALRRAWRGFRAGGDWIGQAWNIGLLGALVAVLVFGIGDPVLISGQVTGILCVLVGLAGAPERVFDKRLAPTISLDEDDLGLDETADEMPAPPYDVREPDAAPRLERVVFLANTPGFGGASQHSLNVAVKLQQRGVRVLVVCPPGARCIPRLREANIPYRALPLGMNAGRWRGYLGTAALFNPISLVRFVRAIRQLQREEPSVFICPFPREQVLLPLIGWRDRIRTIWVLHARLRYRLHRLILRPLMKWLAPRTEAIVTVSRRLEAVTREEGVAGDRLMTIPNAVHVRPLERLEQITDEQQRTPGLIGVTSRLIQSKGVQHVIAAMPYVIKRRPDARLVIAGEGNYEQALRGQVEELALGKHVRFLGYVTRPEDLLNTLSIAVCPSVDPEDTLPTVVLEASAAGLPIIASAVGGIPDLVVDGETGILTPPGDARALAAAIIQLLDDPAQAKSMGVSGYHFVQSHYSLERAGQRFYELLARRIAPSAPRRPRAVSATGSGLRVSAAKVSRSLKAATSKLPMMVATLSRSLSATAGRLRVSALTVSRALKAAVGAPNAADSPRHSWLVGNSALVLASKLMSAAATFIWTVLAARALLPADYGGLMLCLGFVELGAVVADAGVTAVATRDFAQAQPEDIPRLTGALIYLKLGLGFMATLAVVAVGLFLPYGAQVRELALVLGPGEVFIALNTLTLLFRARFSTWYIVALSLPVALFGIGASFFVYIFLPNVGAFTLVRLGTYVAGGLLVLAFVIRCYRPRFRPDQKLIMRMLMSAIPLGLAFILGIFYYRIDVPILGLMAGDRQVAIYTGAYRILDVVTLLPASAAAAALPLIASLARRERRYLMQFAQQYLELAVAAAMFIGLALTLFGGSILDFLYSGRYSASEPILKVLAWVGAVTLVTNVFNPLMIALDHRRLLFCAAGVGLVVNFGLNLLLIPRLQALGAAYATLITELLIASLLGSAAIRALRWRVRLRSLAASGLATLIGIALATLFTRAGMPWWAANSLALAAWLAIEVAVFSDRIANVLPESWRHRLKWRPAGSAQFRRERIAPEFTAGEARTAPRSATVLMRWAFCLILLVNVVSWSGFWAFSAYTTTQRTTRDLTMRLARIQEIAARSDLGWPAMLPALQPEVEAVDDDLHTLQGATLFGGRVQITDGGSGAQQGLAMAIDLADAARSAISAAMIVEGAVIGPTNSQADVESMGPSVRHPLTLDDIHAAQRALSSAEESWRQAQLARGRVTSADLRGLLDPSSATALLQQFDQIAPTIELKLETAHAIVDFSSALLGLSRPGYILLTEMDPGALRSIGGLSSSMDPEALRSSGLITNYAVIPVSRGEMDGEIQLHDAQTLVKIPGAVKKPPAQSGHAGARDPYLPDAGWKIQDLLKLPTDQIRAIVGITPSFLVDALRSIGPVRVPYFDEVVSADTVESRISYYHQNPQSVADHAIPADKLQTSPSTAFDALLFQAISAKLRTLDADQRMALVNVMLNAFASKDLQLFFNDTRSERFLTQMQMAMGGNESGSGAALDSVRLEHGAQNIGNADNGSWPNPAMVETVQDAVHLDTNGGAQHQMTITYSLRPGADAPPGRTYMDSIQVIAPSGARFTAISGPCQPEPAQQGPPAVTCQLVFDRDRPVSAEIAWYTPNAVMKTGSMATYQFLAQQQPQGAARVDVSVTPPANASIATVIAPGMLARGHVEWTFSAPFRAVTLGISFR